MFYISFNIPSNLSTYGLGFGSSSEFQFEGIRYILGLRAYLISDRAFGPPDDAVTALDENNMKPLFWPSAPFHFMPQIQFLASYMSDKVSFPCI